MKTKIMILGLGSLGGHLLSQLRRAPWVESITIVSRNRDYCEKRVNVESVASCIDGLAPTLNYVQMSVESPEFPALLQAQDPDFIIDCTRFAGGMKFSPKQMPFGLAYSGMMSFFALPLPFVIARALKESGIKGKLIETVFPDFVNPVLNRMLELPPEQYLLGAGCLNHTAARIKLAAASQLKVSPTEVTVRMVAGIYSNNEISRNGNEGEAQTFLQVLHGDTDVTKSLGGKSHLYQNCSIPMPEGHERNLMAAASCLSLTEALATEKTITTNTPGVLDLPGGYPICTRAGNIELDLPAAVTREAAIAMNAEILAKDGIGKIDTDGTIHFSERQRTLWQDNLQFDCPSLPPDPKAWRDLGGELRQKLEAVQ